MKVERNGALLRSQGQELEEKTRRNAELEKQVQGHIVGREPCVLSPKPESQSQNPACQEKNTHARVHIGSTCAGVGAEDDAWCGDSTQSLALNHDKSYFKGFTDTPTHGSPPLQQQPIYRRYRQTAPCRWMFQCERNKKAPTARSAHSVVEWYRKAVLNFHRDVFLLCPYGPQCEFHWGSPVQWSSHCAECCC